MFFFDVESLGIESTSVVLSLACTHVTSETDDYQKMLDNSIMLKLNIKEQFAKGRVSDESTLKWWDRQSILVKEASLIPRETDIPVVEAIQLFKRWLKDRDFGGQNMFARGSLDQIVLDSLTRTFDVSSPIAYNRWYDVRTAVDMLYETAIYGYVEVDHPTFKDSMVLKHHPVHDCAYDGMMISYGKK